MYVIVASAFYLVLDGPACRHSRCFCLQLITSVNNLTGNMYVLHHGAMHVANKASGRTAVMAFGEPGNMATNSQKSRKNKNLKVQLLP